MLQQIQKQEDKGVGSFRNKKKNRMMFKSHKINV